MAKITSKEYVLENNIYKVSIVDADYVKKKELSDSIQEWLYWHKVNFDEVNVFGILVLELNSGYFYAIAPLNGILIKEAKYYINIKDHTNRASNIIYYVEDITIADEKDT